MSNIDIGASPVPASSAFHDVGGLRLVRVGLEINGEMTFFEDLDIRIQGTKFASPQWGMCTVKISNLTRDQRHYILTKATPYPQIGAQRQSIRMTVDIGRQQYGYFRLFDGQVYTSTVTAPPDIAIVLRSVASSPVTSLVVDNSFGKTALFKDIAQKVADQNGLQLRFEANNIQVSNYSFTGSASKQIEMLQKIGGVRCGVDNGVLTVIDQDKTVGLDLDMDIYKGMVGIPQATESGVIVQMLAQPGVYPFQKINLKSYENPSVNGSYGISQINYDIANRDQPFFYTLFCTNLALPLGTQ